VKKKYRSRRLPHRRPPRSAATGYLAAAHRTRPPPAVSDRSLPFKCRTFASPSIGRPCPAIRRCGVASARGPDHGCRQRWWLAASYNIAKGRWPVLPSSHHRMRKDNYCIQSFGGGQQKQVEKPAAQAS